MEHLKESIRAKISWAYPHMHGWCTPEKAGAMVDLVFEFRPRVAVEIGVFGGRSLCALALAQKELSFADGRKRLAYGIDPWEKAAALENEQLKENRHWWESLDYEMVLESCRDWIKRLEVEEFVETWRCKALDARHRFREGEIEFLHIDGNHSPVSSCQDVIHWLPRVKPGGVVVFDDADWPGTQAAVALIEVFCERIHDATHWRAYRLVKNPC